MRAEIKIIFADFVYNLYQKKILKNQIHVMSIDETIDELLKTEKSLVRFGDGEIIMINGKNLELQKSVRELSDRLAEILQYRDEKLLVCIPDIFEHIYLYRKSGQQFWKDHLLFFRKVYKKYCRVDAVYGNAYVSRCYYNYEDKAPCAGWFLKLKQVWKDREVVVVEGSRTHNGVGNDLLAEAKSVERVICPAKDAFFKLSQIEEACMKFPTSKLFLISLGATAKPLAEDLFRKGYRVIDIGNLDMEYEWFLRRAEKKEKVFKHSIVGREENEKAGFGEYLEQVREWIE